MCKRGPGPEAFWVQLTPSQTQVSVKKPLALATSEYHDLPTSCVVSHAKTTSGRWVVRWRLLRPRGTVPRPRFVGISGKRRRQNGRIDASKQHHLAMRGVVRHCGVVAELGISRRELLRPSRLLCEAWRKDSEEGHRQKSPSLHLSPPKPKKPNHHWRLSRCHRYNSLIIKASWARPA